MTHRFLLSTLLLALVVSAPAAQRATDGTGESWIFSSDENGSGSSYLGVDIARTAIDAGLSRKRVGRWPDCINFIQGEISSLHDNRHDIVLSLGLLDWLNDEELKHLFRFQGRSDFFHAISERSNRIDQWLHRAYVQLSYGYRTGSYRPRYFSCAEIAALTPSTVQTYVYRHPRLRFGGLLSSFPVAYAQPVMRSR